MTRDEAAKIAKAFWGGSALDGIDMLVALGMLKLDEPKSFNERIEDALARFTDQAHPNEVVIAFDNAGLKIVEK